MIWIILIVIATLIVLFWAYMYYVLNIRFFRDPPRKSPGDNTLVMAPCDGRVMYVRKISGSEVVSEKLGRSIRVTEILKAEAPEEGYLVGIYMSPFDVHFNYAPVAGEISDIVYTPARMNLPMVDIWEYIRFCFLHKAVDLMGKKFHLENERNTIFIKGPRRIAMVEIADLVVNKIDCYIKPGQAVKQGEKVSFIKRGSQVDLFLWGYDYEFLVHPGMHVTGAETVIARIVNTA